MTKSRGKRRQKVTLQHVADAAKVSKATASLALNNNPRISEPTRQRVLDAVEALGYVYNQRAASLRTQRSYTIGLVFKDVSNPFNAELTSGAESQLADHNYSLVLATTNDNLEKQARMVKTMLERDVDGLILAPTATTAAASLQSLMDFCPLVLLTPYYESLAVDCVGMDDANGTARAVEHLIRQGHRRIAFVGGFATDLTRQRRLQSYRGTLERHNIEFDPALRIAGPVTRRGGYDAVHQLLSVPRPPSAAYCYSDVIAFGVMLGLRAAGMEAGRDFAVIGFDDVPEASLWHPSLTTVSNDPRGLGEQAAQLMLRRLATADATIKRVIMPSHLVLRDSTAAPVHEMPS
ncbi:MAG: LacI family DNA-binding transcriptional regulator [Chloroflexota bacterium]|nr:LacI family DNA-binding transcriptional regulator [Chloroflexota bacterium]